MGKRFPLERWALPADIDPSTSVCFTIPVPDDPMHIAAFKGAIYALCWSNNWGKDSGNSAAAVSRVWQEIFDNLKECMHTQYRQLESCILEASNDGGATWDIIFDASSCVREGIVDAIQDGTISGGSQPPGGGDGNGGQCYTYYVTLAGNGKWRAPIAIDAGDVITVSNVQGAWYDGDVARLGRWDCADGQAFALGTCQPGLTYDAGDPLPASPHMMVIGGLPLETAPFFELFNTNYTVINGPQDFDIQANDGLLTDNAGSITFQVEICKGLWCVEYDFTANDQNWFNAAHNGEAGCLGSYHAATGWVSDCQPGGTFQRISIGYGLDLTDTVVTALEVDVNSATGSSTHSLYIRAFGVDVYNSGGAGVLPSGNSTNVFSGQTLTNDDIQWITYDTPAGEPITIKRVRLRGSGPRPAGEPSC